MSDTLVRIKRAILAGHYAFSEKASLEMEADGLTELDILEGLMIYPKGKLVQESGVETYYFLISSKTAL